MKSFGFFEAKLAGIDCIISRTGYKRAKVCFELFVHPDFAARLWWRLLDEGKALGVVPCGLGARDSLRWKRGCRFMVTSLMGRIALLFEAGYGWAVKLDKEFFIGKTVMEKVSKTWHGLPARENTAKKMAVPPMNVARWSCRGKRRPACSAGRWGDNRQGLCRVGDELLLRPDKQLFVATERRGPPRRMTKADCTGIYGQRQDGRGEFG